jgi:hypothetical protein
MSQRSAEARKWFEVPPSGIGRLSRSSAGNSPSNSAQYSMVNWLVSQLSEAL